jgi:hypothetical protein
LGVLKNMQLLQLSEPKLLFANILFVLLAKMFEYVRLLASYFSFLAKNVSYIQLVLAVLSIVYYTHKYIILLKRSKNGN